MRRIQSRLWSVVAYFAMAVWLMVSFFLPSSVWMHLLPLNGLVHYATTLSLSVVSTEWMGRKKTLVLLFGLIAAWEVFEFWWFSSLQQNILHDTTQLAYYSDTLADVALGIAGTLSGVYFGVEPLNTSRE